MKKSFLVAASALIALFSTQLSAVSASAVEPVCTINVPQSNDQISGTNLGDVICITGDNNVVNALGGDDTVIDDGTDNTINLGEGFDTYDGTGGDGSTVDGGSGDDNLIGTPGPDELTGGDGDDTLVGGEEDDTLNGGLGADDLSGSAGDDAINGEAGPDDIDGGDGADILNGGDADDTLIGAIGNDTMNGGLGADQLQGDAGADDLYGEAGTDTLSGGEGDDILAGGADIDTISGGTGLNICDYNSGEKLTATCAYDDQAPTLAGLNISPLPVNSSASQTNMDITIHVRDQIGVASAQLVCRLEIGVTSFIAIDATFTESLAKDNFTNNQLLNFLQTGTNSDIVWQASYPLLLGAYPGDYRCSVVLRDKVNHERAEGTDTTVVVERSGSGWDDSAPAVEVFEFSSPTVDLLAPSNTTVLHMQLTDATEIGWGYITCEDARGNRAVELIYNSQTVFNYKNGINTSPLVSTPKTLEYFIPLEMRVGQAPGTYVCWVSVRDNLHHEARLENVASLEVIDSASLADSVAPSLLSSTFSSSSFDVGQSSAKGLLLFRLKDSSKLGWSYLNCEFSRENILHRILGAGVEPYRFYDYDNGWVEGAEYFGTSKDMTFSLPIKIPMGAYPGTYECWIGATDEFANGARYVLATFDVFRTPAGQPSDPSALTYSPTQPTSGALSWSAPTNLGDPALYAYVSEYSTDGTTWKVLPKSGTKATSLDVSGLKADTDYWFRVRGENGGTVGQDTSFMNLNWATIKIHTPAPVIPDAPINLVVSNVTSSGYKLAWTAPVYNGGSAITDFKVEASSDGGKTWKLARAAVSTSLSVTVSGAAPGTTYQVRVSAINGVGASDYLAGSVTTDATAPTAPRNLTSKNIAPKSLTLFWQLPSSNGGLAITDYKVEVSSNGGTTWTVINDGVSTNLAVDISNLLKNRSYKFRVTAINSLGAGNVSDVYTVSTLSTTASNPLDLVLKDIASNSAVLNWSAPSDFGGVSLTDYKVETSRDGMTWAVMTKSVSLTRSLKLTGLAPGTTYQVRISAINSVGASDPLSGSVTTLAVVPTVPRSLKVTGKSLSTATLAWSLPASNGGSAITDYKVEVSSNCSTFTTISRAASKNLGFKVTGLKAGTKYCFRVSAKNSVGFSDASSELTVVTDGNAPNAPTSLAVKASTTSVTLSWKAATVTDGSPVRNYIVEYSKNGGSSWVKVSKPVSTSWSLKVTGLKGKTTYLFRVTAVNDVGNSKASKNLKVVTG